MSIWWLPLIAQAMVAKPVRHGKPFRHFKRIYNSDGEVVQKIVEGWECPFCHNLHTSVEEDYCSYCGAKMDGDVNDVEVW